MLSADQESSPENISSIEQLYFHFSLSCIGEGNGNPLQCSCLENPRDGGAWWTALYGVAQSRTRLNPGRGAASEESCSPGRRCPLAGVPPSDGPSPGEAACFPWVLNSCIVGSGFPYPPARPVLELRLSDNAVPGVLAIHPPEKRRFPFMVFPRGEAGQLSDVPISQTGNWKERSEKAESPSPAAAAEPVHSSPSRSLLRS